MKKNLPYQYFLRALDSWINGQKKKKMPYQKNLAIGIGVTEPTISKYLKTKETNIIPFHSQVSIAEYIDDDYLSFLEKGKIIYEIEHPAKIKKLKPLTKHQKLVQGFEDQERACRINSKLLHAERIDYDSLDTIENIIDAQINGMEKKHGDRQQQGEEREA